MSFRKFFSAGIAAILYSLLSLPAQAASLVVVGGELQGATGVTTIYGTYDVTFIDGTCVDLFSGCDDAASDFIFSTEAEADAAAQALLDQVFLDATEGQFDSDPTLTRGCEFAETCLAVVPWRINGIGFVVGGTSINKAAGFGVDAAGGTITIGPLDDSSSNSRTYAVFSTVVPLPAAVWLFGSALAGLGWLRQKQAV